MYTLLARYKKAVVTALGYAALLAATIPPDSPEWRWAQLVLAVAGVVGVAKARNAPEPAPPGR